MLTLINEETFLGCKRPIKTCSFWWPTGKGCEFITIVNSILALQTANEGSSTSYVIRYPGFREANHASG